MGRWTFAALALLLVVASAPADARDLVLAPTGEAAVAQPTVVLTLGERRGSARRNDKADGLGDLLGDLPTLAILDTGASGHVLSAGTAARFGVEPEPGARYVESGLSGDHTLAVSRPVSLEVGDLEPGEDRPRRRPASHRLSEQRLLLNEAPSDLTAALLSPGAMVDVVGMPLIRERVIEIVPTTAELSALAVRLHASTAGLTVDAWIALDLVDFNHPHPKNRGVRPSLATNPLVVGVAVSRGSDEVENDWLLDTGAACSMISTAVARALGLVDASGAPSRPPDFTLPLGGVGGGHEVLPGFRVDTLTLPATDGRRLVFRNPAVVVRDIAGTRADGTPVTLDGILGMNLLLPSGNGMSLLGAARQLPGPFARVVIDVPRERLGLALRLSAQ